MIDAQDILDRLQELNKENWEVWEYHASDPTTEPTNIAFNNGRFSLINQMFATVYELLKESQNV
jgi:hypothetical protein